jgi:hypothetical protein
VSVPTRDEDWWQLIEGDDPDDALAPILRRGQDSWHLFEALVAMDSAIDAHDAIAQADDETVRRALMAAVISRVGTPLTPEARINWMRQNGMRQNATGDDIAGIFDFPRPPQSGGS